MTGIQAKVLAIIPARGGSKGLPRKNVLDLAGKPLIAWTVQAAVGARLVDRVVVSTEDDEIARTAMHWGAEVPFLRPPEMAADNVSAQQAVEYTVKRMAESGYDADFVCVLAPTSPFRSIALIDFLVGKGIEGYRQVVTVKKVDSGPGFFTDRGGRLTPLADGFAGLNKPGRYYRPYGLFVMWRVRNPEEGSAYMHVIRDKAEFIDIDTARDLRLAEAIIEHGLYDFGRND